MRDIVIGNKYRHFKGHEYVVIAIANDSESLEKMVVYKNLNGSDCWVRSYNMFNSLVDKEKYPNVEQKYRFEEIN